MPGELTTVAVGLDAPLAHLLKGRLESEGIPAFVLDEHHLQMNPPAFWALGGCRIQVPSSLAERARELLDEDHSEELRRVPESRIPAAREGCPRCGSDSIRRSEPGTTTRRLGYWLGIMIGVPLPFSIGGSRRLCETCNHRWRARSG